MAEARHVNSIDSDEPEIESLLNGSQSNNKYNTENNLQYENYAKPHKKDEVDIKEDGKKIVRGQNNSLEIENTSGCFQKKRGFYSVMLV